MHLHNLSEFAILMTASELITLKALVDQTAVKSFSVSARLTVGALSPAWYPCVIQVSVAGWGEKPVGLAFLGVGLFLLFLLFSLKETVFCPSLPCLSSPRFPLPRNTLSWGYIT